MAIAAGLAILGLVAGLFLRQRGILQDDGFGVYACGGVCGAAAMLAMHPRHPLLVTVVFLPAMTAVAWLALNMFLLVLTALAPRY